MRFTSAYRIDQACRHQLETIIHLMIPYVSNDTNDQLSSTYIPARAYPVGHSSGVPCGAVEFFVTKLFAASTARTLSNGSSSTLEPIVLICNTSFSAGVSLFGDSPQIPLESLFKVAALEEHYIHKGSATKQHQRQVQHRIPTRSGGIVPLETCNVLEQFLLVLVSCYVHRL